MNDAERIAERGRWLAAQLGGTFHLDPRKVRDFLARRAALKGAENAAP